MSDDIDDINDARWKIGAEKIADVYQGMVPAVPPGLMEFSDIMIRDLFGGIWTREQLDVSQRRLIVMGVIAAIGGPNTLEAAMQVCAQTGRVD